MNYESDATKQERKQEVQVGTNVRVGIPDVDRARNQQRNVIGVVVEVGLSVHTLPYL